MSQPTLNRPRGGAAGICIYRKVDTRQVQNIDRRKEPSEVPLRYENQFRIEELSLIRDLLEAIESPAGSNRSDEDHRLCICTRRGRGVSVGSAAREDRTYRSERICKTLPTRTDCGGRAQT